MWKSRKKSGLPGFFMWSVLLKNEPLSTEESVIILATVAFSTFHSPIVDYMILLLLTLELMSRMIEAMEGSFSIMSSTLRMELSTVA